MTKTDIFCAGFVAGIGTMAVCAGLIIRHEMNKLIAKSVTKQELERLQKELQRLRDIGMAHRWKD